MHKLWLVIKREYITRVRTKGFVFSTVAVPLLTLGLFGFEIYTANMQLDHTLKIAIVDQSGGLADSVAKNLNGTLANGRPEFLVVKTLVNPSAEDQKALRAQVEHDDLDAFLVIPAGVADGKTSAEFHTKNTGEIDLSGSLGHAVSDAVIAERLREQGLKVRDVGRVVQGVDMKVIKVSAEGEIEEKGQTFIVAIAVGMLLYTTLIIYGVSTMRSVMEEKTSRVIEILVASMRPTYLLSGKILGVAAVGITQYAIWGAVAALVAAYGATMAKVFRPGSALPPLHLPWTTLLYVVLFFLSGYMLYASLYAAVGAMVSTDQEAQQVQTPITMLIVASFVLFTVILHDPNSSLSVGLSLIPFFAPILMVLRICLQTPPFWQIALAIGISVLSTAGIVFFSARVYRVGILMYGKRPSLAELAKWMKYT